MATYTELHSLFNNAALINRVAVALLVAVDDLLTDFPTANDKAYASVVFSSPQGEAKKVVMAVLAANSGATLAQITGATDTAIQTKVDAVVPALVDALAGV